MTDVPHLLHTVLDAREVRREAEFWRELLGLLYRPGDEVPDDPDEPLRAYASPEGHVFCVFVD